MTPFLNAMKNNFSMNNGLGFVLSLGLILMLLFGVSYNPLLVALSTELMEKIPLYYVSTRDPQSTSYEIVTGPVGYQNETYRDFSGLTENSDFVPIIL